MNLDPKVTNVLMNLFEALAPGTTITMNVPASKIIIPGRKNISQGGQLIVTRPAYPVAVSVKMSERPAEVEKTKKPGENEK